MDRDPVDYEQAFAGGLNPLISRSGAQTLERGLDLIERIVDRPMSVRELATSSGLSLATTRRLVGALSNSGYLRPVVAGNLGIGPKLLHLGARAQLRTSFVDIAKEHLPDLAEATGMPSYLGERDKDHSVHLYRAAGTQRVMVNTPVGTRRLLPETSLGKALVLDDPESEWERLCELAQIQSPADQWIAEMRIAQKRGIVLHEIPPPDLLRAIAVPVRDASERIVCAISVVTSAQYADAAEIERIAPLVTKTAQAISHELGHKP